jgi:hypothetical protein
MTHVHSPTDHDTRVAEIAGNLERLFDPGTTVELRVLGERVLSGCFDDWELLAASALAANLDHANVYYGLNPRRRQATNELSLVRAGEANSAADVRLRRWLPVDFDPVCGLTRCAATDQERAPAKQALVDCLKWLNQRGWPAPLVGSTGNGFRLLYRIDLPVPGIEGQRATNLVKAVLHVLANKFSVPDKVKIDAALYDAPRLDRLYGSVNHRGVDTPERPWRRSKLYEGGGQQVVPEAKLRDVAGLAGATGPARQTRRSAGDKAQGGAQAEKPGGRAGPAAALPEGRHVIKLAFRWLKEQQDALDGLVNGEGRTGGGQTLYIATELQRGWGLRRRDAWRLLCWYNKHKCRGPWDKAKLRHKLDDGTRAARQAERDNPGLTGWRARARATVVLDANEHRVSAEAEAALAQAINLYQYSETLVSVRLRGDDDDRTSPLVQRHPATPVIRPLTKPLLRDELSRQVKFVKLSRTQRTSKAAQSTTQPEPPGPQPEPQGSAPGSGTGTSSGAANAAGAAPAAVPREEQGEPLRRLPAHVPGFAVNTIYDRGHWPSVPKLRGVAAHPIILDSGEVLASRGYHQRSGLFLWLPRRLRLQLPNQPGQADARAAAAALLDPVRDFPFARPEHRSAWAAAVLTALARRAFAGPAPLFLVDGNTPGVGKGLLVQVIAHIVVGHPFSTATYSHEGGELRKLITTLAMGGDETVLFDNVRGQFGNPTLDEALTSPRWKDRLLGLNREFDGPLNITWLATGNNVVLVGDTTRRVLHIRLNSPVEEPEKRAGFVYPKLLDHVKQARSGLLSAALTILRAYWLAGKPNQGLEPWGSFEGWSDTVRSACVWAGLPDPGLTRAGLTGADPKRAALATLFEALATAKPSGWLASEIIGKANLVSPEGLALKEALLVLCPNRDGKLSTVALGTKLSFYRERVVGGHRLVALGESNKGWRWAAVPIEPPRVVGATAAPGADTGPTPTQPSSCEAVCAATDNKEQPLDPREEPVLPTPTTKAATASSSAATSQRAADELQRAQNSAGFVVP